MASEEELINIRNKIECMPKFNQIEVLKILNKEQIVLNENKNGVHVNLSDINEDIIEKLIKYINYFVTQENNLDELEKQKEDFLNTYFNKSKKV
jgi:hypothetical protein